MDLVLNGQPLAVKRNSVFGVRNRVRYWDVGAISSVLSELCCIDKKKEERILEWEVSGSVSVLPSLSCVVLGKLVNCSELFVPRLVGSGPGGSQSSRSHYLGTRTLMELMKPTKLFPREVCPRELGFEQVLEVPQCTSSQGLAALRDPGTRVTCFNVHTCLGLSVCAGQTWSQWFNRYLPSIHRHYPGQRGHCLCC